MKWLVRQQPIRRLTLRPAAFLNGGGAGAKAVALQRRGGRDRGRRALGYRAGEAKTCFDRLKVCQRFCVKSEAGSPACMSVCSRYLQACLASGCWESNYVDKECGFTRQ